MRNFVRSIMSVFMLAVVAVCSVAGYYIYNLPDEFYVTKGNSLIINSKFDIESCDTGLVKQSVISSDMIMESGVTLKLFGKIPIKDVRVKSVEQPTLIVGGNPFGIKIITEGVMVIGVTTVDTCNGEISPAESCGIEEGDIILSINGTKITSNETLQDAIMRSQGNKVNVTVKRGNTTQNVILSPVYSLSEASYKAGMWVRDSSAGIGTITFYDPVTKSFGGLGHPVCDSDTGTILPIHSGEVVAVTISGYKKGESGKPGELIGSFISSMSTGNLIMNNQSGVFGTLDSAPNLSSPVPLGYRQEIKQGKATILTTIKGNSPKQYEIEIERIDLKSDELSKNMIIKVTDKELLEQTGGILQGMSGSPIIQNGKIVGAVTHVFVNDPTRGYAIFADIMYDYTMQISNNNQ